MPVFSMTTNNVISSNRLHGCCKDGCLGVLRPHGPHAIPIHDPSSSGLDDALLSVAVNGKIALAMRGRFFLRCFCKSFSEKSHIGCAVTDQDRCLEYLRSDEFELLICTDQLERGNGYELVRRAKEATFKSQGCCSCFER